MHHHTITVAAFLALHLSCLFCYAILSIVNTSCAGGRHNMPPAPCKLTFDLLTLKVVSEWPSHVGYLCANFSLPRPLCSRLRPDVRDRQTDVRRASLLNTPYPGGGIINYRLLLPGSVKCLFGYAYYYSTTAYNYHHHHQYYLQILFNWRIFPLRVWPGPQRATKEQGMGTAGARFFTGSMPFLSSNLQCQSLFGYV